MRRILAAAIFAAVAAGFTPALAFSPSVQVLPGSVANGQTANVYGSDYCADAGCSKVSVTVGGQLVASAIQVDSAGNFHATFRVNEFPGSYHVTASQTITNGSMIQATTGMTVQLSDPKQPSPTPPGGGVASPPTIQPEVSQRPSPEVGASPSIPTGSSASPPSSTVTPSGQPSPSTVSQNPFLLLGILIVVLLAVGAAAVAAVAWRRRRESQ